MQSESSPMLHTGRREVIDIGHRQIPSGHSERIRASKKQCSYRHTGGCYRLTVVTSYLLFSNTQYKHLVMRAKT